MNIRSFLNRYNNCLKCNKTLELSTKFSSKIYISKITHAITDDKISFKLFCDPDSNKTNLKLSMSFQTNTVSYTPKMKEFMKESDLEILLVKSCKNCSYLLGPHKEVGFFYSGKLHKPGKFFELDLLAEGFTLEDDDDIYHFFNFFEQRQGLLLKQGIKRTMQVPIIPLDKFHFENHNLVCKKVQDLLILAG
jgi:hypothetical protein